MVGRCHNHYLLENQGPEAKTSKLKENDRLDDEKRSWLSAKSGCPISH